MGSHRGTAYATGVAIILVSGLSFFWEAPVELIGTLIGENKVLGSALFMLIMFTATIIAPVTALPIVPLVSPVLGPFLTGTLSIISWGLGAIVAFLIARHAGRPLLSKIISLEAIDRYESYIPTEAHFLLIVVLRMSIPVDVLSYALGLFSRVSLGVYTAATFVGIAWFAYAFAYLGEAALTKNTQLFVIIGALSLAVFGLSWLYVIQQMRRKKEDKEE